VTTRKPFDIAVTDFAHSIGLLVRRARSASATQDLSWTETAVLKRLDRHGPATTADLARAQGMRPQSMRPILATLEQLGMVKRKPHPTDGRQVNIVLTAKGAATEKILGEAKHTWLAKSFAQLSERERETLFAAGEIIKRLNESNPQ
jgi:DNA-binding MarR family transcriptional regulator